MFIAKHNPSIQNLNPMALKNKLFNKLLEIFQKNKIPISEDKMTNIFGILDSNLNTNNKIKDNKLEKEFSEALLNIGANQKKKNNIESDYSLLSKKKPIFKINNAQDEQDIKQDNFDFYYSNLDEKDSNFIINIDEKKENNLEEEKKTQIYSEPIKSNHYCIKQFSFDDFVLKYTN